MELRVERTGEYIRISNKLDNLRLEFIRRQAIDPNDPRLDRLRVEMTILKRSLIILDYERDGKEPPKIFRRESPDD